MYDFTPRVFEVAVTYETFESLRELMELTGKSFGNICRDGLIRAIDSFDPEAPITIPAEWLQIEKDPRSRANVRMATEVQQNLDTLAQASQVTWNDMASYVLECEVAYSLFLLKTPFDN